MISIELIRSDPELVREVMRNGENGLVVPQHDAVALADAIRRLMLSPDLARHLGARGAADVRVFTMERMAAAYQSCYESLANGGQSS